MSDPAPSPTGLSSFQRHADLVKLDRGLVEEERLREAQLGACGALLAHASTSDEPAQIVLPTGVGKSLVLTLAPYLLRANRVLVVAPARLVRDQLAAGFKTLEQATSAGVLPEGTPPPTVEVARHLATAQHWAAWQEADVVVGTPNVLSDGFPEVTRVPPSLFDLVIFDEAHHLPSFTWTKLHEAVAARAVLMTATPFRSDGERLRGRMAYVYPLQRAIDAGVYAPVRFVPVAPAAGIDKDQALAAKAKERLLSAEHRATDSRLLVRANRVQDAERLVELYRSAELPLGLVLGRSSARTVAKTMDQVRSGELLGFVCVGSLTEGFDFPTLKIAAYHAPHRSLPPTLQFVGRLSRVTRISGELIADPAELSTDTAVLYRRDEAWSRLLPQIVDASVAREHDTRRFLDDAAVDLRAARLPWLSVAPSRSVHIYRLAEAPDLDFEPDELGTAHVVQRLFQSEQYLVALLTEERLRPRFATSRHLDAVIHRLHLATWVSNPGLLFVSSESPAARRQLLDASGAGMAPLIDAEDLRRLLAATNVARFFNVGLRESRPRQAFAASYATLAGAHAEAAVGPEDVENKLLGHAMGRSGTGSGTFGISTAKGKYWEPTRAESLYEFRKWCEGCASSIRSATSAPTAISGLRIADRIHAFPDYPIAATLNERFLSGEWTLRVGGTPIPPMDVELDVTRTDAHNLHIELRLDGTLLGAVQQTSRGTFDADARLEMLDTETGEVRDLDAALEDAPPTVYFGDGTVVVGTSSSSPTIDEGTDPPAFARAVSWNGVDLRAEASNPKKAHITIQDATLRMARAGATWVITDHGSGEMADFIALTLDGNRVDVDLLHCKGSRKDPGARVDDLYDVVGQALRSIRHCRTAARLALELQSRLNRRKSMTKLVAGDRKSLDAALGEWAEGHAPLPTFRVVVVQPALLRDQSGARGSVRQLLFAANAHCLQQGVELSVWCNDGS